MEWTITVTLWSSQLNIKGIHGHGVLALSATKQGNLPPSICISIDMYVYIYIYGDRHMSYKMLVLIKVLSRNHGKEVSHAVFDFKSG